MKGLEDSVTRLRNNFKDPSAGNGRALELNQLRSGMKEAMKSVTNLQEDAKDFRSQLTVLQHKNANLLSRQVKSLDFTITMGLHDLRRVSWSRLSAVDDNRPFQYQSLQHQSDVLTGLRLSSYSHFLGSHTLSSQPSALAEIGTRKPDKFLWLAQHLLLAKDFEPSRYRCAYYRYADLFEFAYRQTIGEAVAFAASSESRLSTDKKPKEDANDDKNTKDREDTHCSLLDNGKNANEHGSKNGKEKGPSATVESNSDSEIGDSSMGRFAPQFHNNEDAFNCNRRSATEPAYEPAFSACEKDPAMETSEDECCLTSDDGSATETPEEERCSTCDEESAAETSDEEGGSTCDDDACFEVSDDDVSNDASDSTSGDYADGEALNNAISEVYDRALKRRLEQVRAETKTMFQHVADVETQAINEAYNDVVEDTVDERRKLKKAFETSLRKFHDPIGSVDVNVSMTEAELDALGEAHACAQCDISRGDLANTALARRIS
ncbi:MAG: hypothetical protein M1831_005192 [Alyxoria varia]|nr:MAG: hypothetical protein M1831_005192 [Alyxoria varia]